MLRCVEFLFHYYMIFIVTLSQPILHSFGRCVKMSDEPPTPLKKGSEMTNVTFFTRSISFRLKFSSRIARRAPMAHRQPLGDPLPFHGRFGSQAARQSRFGRITLRA
jgi:hypothetical protein